MGANLPHAPGYHALSRSQLVPIRARAPRPFLPLADRNTNDPPPETKDDRSGQRHPSARVVGLKSSDWNIYYMRRLLQARPDIVVFHGMDEVLYPGLLYGAHGGIGMWYNVFPGLFLGLFEAAAKGNGK